VLDYGRPTRRMAPAMLLFLLLGLAVFLSGLGYKLSLYRSEASQRAVPAAKLLSQKERASASANERLFARGRFVPTVPREKQPLGNGFLAATVSGENLSQEKESVATSICDQAHDPGERDAIRPRAPPVTA